MLTPSEHDDSNVIYLIGFTHKSAGDLLEDCGLNHIIRSKCIGNIRFWYTELDKSEFSGPVAEKNLQDIQWLTPRVLAHQKAVDTISEIGAIYPARFATLFSSLEVLELNVRRWNEQLAAYFQKVEGKREFGLKVFATEQIAAVPATAKNPDGGGRGYLLARRQASEAKQRRSEAFANIVSEIADSLSDFGADVARRSTVTLNDPDDDRTLIGNIAILITLGDESRIKQVAQAYSGQIDPTFRIETVISGPWAPYSFCPDLESATESVASA